MFRCLRLAVLVILLCSVPAPAQTGSPNSQNQYRLLQQWYRRYLDREPDADGLEKWLTQFRQGVTPQVVLAGILASEEYYQRAGASDDRFLRSIYADVVGREPNAAERRDGANLLRRRTRQEVAQLVLQQNPAGWNPPNPGNESGLLAVLDATVQLGAEIESLAQDIVDEVPGPNGRLLYQRVASVHADVRTFEQRLRRGVAADQLLRDHRQLDRNVDDLLALLAPQVVGNHVLERSLRRVRHADEHLDRIVGIHKPWPIPDGQEYLLRQARALAAETAQFRQIGAFLAESVPTNEAFLGKIAVFVQAVERFQQSVRAGRSVEHLRREFAGLKAAWDPVIVDLNRFPPVAGYYQMRLQAQKVDEVGQAIRRQLGISEGWPPTIMPITTATP